MNSPLLLLTLSIVCQSALAQAPQETRRLPIVSPEVAGGRVTFRYSAPKAQQVTLTIFDMNEAPVMQKDEQGIWSATVEGLAPEIYEYQFTDDGIRTIDPLNPWLKSGRRPDRSLVEVSGHPLEIWEARDVPHGGVTMHTFFSKALGAVRTFRVYTPPDYDRKPDARFPVLYLLHGSGDMDDGWTTVGRAHLIADNLLAAGQAKPALIVMPNGSYPRVEGHENGFETDLFEVIAPFVEAHYRVAPGAGNHAMAGLSMGGAQTLNVGTKHLDALGALGVFSLGVREDDFAETHADFLRDANAKLALIWIGAGETDRLFPGVQKLEELLTEHHVKFTARHSAGGHTWSNWRHYLAEFLPLLFTTGKP